MSKLTGLVSCLLALTLAGCYDENVRVAEVAREAANRQAEQNRQMAELHKQVAEGSKRLVEAEAQTRGELTALQRDLQQSQADVGRQRDQLEGERREFADHRHRDPIVAAVITDFGMVLACILPLLLAAYVLYCVRDPAQTDATMAEILVQELVAEKPFLLPPPKFTPGLENRPIPLTDEGTAPN